MMNCLSKRKEIWKLGYFAITAFFVILISSCGDDEPAAPAPFSAFSFTSTANTPIEAALNFSFTNESTLTDDLAEFSWDFGDQTGISTEKNPTYSYAESGSYTVSLTVTNPDGQKNSTTKEVVIGDGLLVGTWRMDSTAVRLIDTLATVGGIEYGSLFNTDTNEPTWDGTNWTSIGLFGPGYSTFWSDAIMVGSYFGKTELFGNEFTFTSSGGFQRELYQNTLWAFDSYFDMGTADDRQNVVEGDSWKNIDGASLDAYKSNTTDYTYTVSENTDYPNNSTDLFDINLSGLGAWMGIYFAGNSIGLTPQNEYKYTIVSIDQESMVVFGESNLFADQLGTSIDVILVLKFKRVQ